MIRTVSFYFGLLPVLFCGYVNAAEVTNALANLPPELLQPLLREYQQHKHDLGNSRYVGLLNYRLPSWEPRFYVIDPDEKRVVAAYRVAHGKGSDPDHDGIAEYFSDREGSYMSSVGLFLTRNTYISNQPAHGLSLRMHGLSNTNSRAQERNIVIHANDYMEQQFIDTYGVPGRSHGCLVFSATDRDEVVKKLSGGALIYAAR